MPEILIGARAIPYAIQRSSRAARKRIEVSPRGVNVIVPADASTADVERFIARKRRWIHDKTEEIREEVDRLRADTPQGFHSGAKVLFRGRYLGVRIRTIRVKHPTLRYRTGFHIDVPRRVPRTDHEAIARGLINEWIEERLVEDAWAIVRERGMSHELEPADIRIKDQRTLWGSCGRDKVVRLDRKLGRVPRPVFEYVVVHEICHLRHKDHSAGFWSLVKDILPDYRERREWLEQHEVKLL